MGTTDGGVEIITLTLSFQLKYYMDSVRWFFSFFSVIALSRIHDITYVGR